MVDREKVGIKGKKGLCYNSSSSIIAKDKAYIRLT